MTSIDILAPLSGGLVGLILGLVGGGGSILAVPLLIYVVGIGSTHLAIGTSAVAVAASAAVNLIPHWRNGRVKWPCALVFSASGIIGAYIGASVAKLVDGQILLSAFGGLMLVVGLVMLFKKGGEGDPDVRLKWDSAIKLGPKLVLIGLAVGGLSGFFGIGGGFLIVPGLMLATGMPLIYAIGTSLVAVSAFGITTAATYAISGLVDWRIAGLFVAGGALGGVLGAFIGGKLAGKGRALNIIFALVVLSAGGFIVYDGVMTLLG